MDQVGEDLCALVRRIQGACFLIAVPSGQVIAMSDAAPRLLGLEPAAVVGRPVSALLRGLWRSEPMRLLLAESQTGFATLTSVRRADGKLVECSAAVRLVRTPGLRWVVIAVDEEVAGGGGKLLRLTDDAEVIIGAGDGKGGLAEVSPNVQDLLGYDAATFVGLTHAGLIHADDFSNFNAAASAVVSTRRTGSVRLRMRHADGSWVPLRLFLSPLGPAKAARLGFIIIPDTADFSGSEPPDGFGYEQMQQRLRRIALEIAALGLTEGLGPDMAPDDARVLAELSSKRQEIVRRLQAGERVPTIAEQMYLSQSTIRNHLSATFRHFGVSSQEELVRRLRSGSPSVN